MALPERDLDRIRLWCREMWPENFWDQVKCEADVADRHIDIVEVRPLGANGEDIREQIARLRYTMSTGLWTLYWCDSNFKFHVYPHKRPAKRVQTLLDHIENSGDPTFWG